MYSFSSAFCLKHKSSSGEISNWQDLSVYYDYLNSWNSPRTLKYFQVEKEDMITRYLSNKGLDNTVAVKNKTQTRKLCHYGEFKIVCCQLSWNDIFSTKIPISSFIVSFLWNANKCMWVVKYVYVYIYLVGNSKRGLTLRQERRL